MAPRLLLVEDNPDYAFLVERMLRDSWSDARPDHAERLDDAVRLLHERHYDCVLLDLGLPDGSRSEVLSVVHNAAGEVPVVVLTAFGDEVDGEDALRNGAQDYLLKERVKGAELHRSIRYAIERSAAADAVRRSGERLQLLLAGISDIVVVLAPDGAVSYISPSAERVLGYSLHTLASSARSRLVHPDDLAAVEDRMRDLQAGRTLDEPLRFRIRHADGSWRVLEAVGSTTVDDPDLRGIVVTLHDVTDWERAQQEVAARVAQQAMLAELGRAALNDLDTDALLQQAADGVTATFGIEYGSALEWSVAGGSLVVRAATGFMPEEVGLSSVTPEDLYDFLRAADIEVSSCLTAAIGGRDRPFGVFVVGSRGPRRFSPDDVGFLESVTNLLAVAIERRRTEEEIRHQALHDALTGLPNRTMLTDRMSVALADMHRTGHEVALLLMDLDGFKEINDTLGHHIGDRVLCEVARRLTEVVRTTDTVARLGGDEFAVLCTHLAAEEATGVATKILGTLRPPCYVDGLVLHVQGSIGLAFAPGDGVDVGTLLKRADAAMYRAKRSGTGLSVGAGDEERPSRLHAVTDTQLRAALEGDELILHYQPTIDLDTGRMVGMEALVRWRHPVRGLLSADRFVPLAERSGLIGALTSWVLDRALADARTWRHDGREVPVSIGLSPLVLRDTRFPAAVGAALAKAGVPASLLELVVPDVDPESESDTVAALAALGVGLSVGDLGGRPFSSFRPLQ